MFPPVVFPDPMPHELEGFDAKLARADTHFNAVKLALEEVTKSDPDLIPGEFDAQASGYLFRAQRDSRDATWLSSVIGDCVHNLRAALDYLVWELAPESARSSKGATSIEFPIFTDPLKYRDGAPKRIGSLDPNAQAVIERLQPFAGPNSDPFDPRWRDPETEPLAFLYALDNWDKHRSLNATESVISGTLTGFEQLGIRTAATPAIIPGRFKRGAILALAQMPFAGPDVNVYLRAAYDIAFQREGPAGGEPVIQTLDHIRQEVRGRVLPALAPFFPPR